MTLDPTDPEGTLREIVRRLRAGEGTPILLLTEDEVDAILAVYPDQKEEPMAEPVKQAVLKESALAGIRAKRLSIRECCARLRLVQDDPEKWLKALMEFCVERDMPEARGADFALRIWRDQHRVPDPGPPEPECKHLEAGKDTGPTHGGVRVNADGIHAVACDWCEDWVPVLEVLENLRAALREARDAARAAFAEKDREIERLRRLADDHKRKADYWSGWAEKKMKEDLP